MIALPRETVRECFEGRFLARSHVVARLTAARFGIIFGTFEGDEKKRRAGVDVIVSHELGRKLRQIGRAIADAYVCAQLADASVGALLEAARAGKDPRAQLEAVAAASAARDAKKLTRRGTLARKRQRKAA